MTSTPTWKSLLSEIEEQAERHPTRIALRSTRDCTYAELMTQMHHAVRVVQGTAPHDSQRPVLILGPTDIATAILVLGVMRAGRIVGVLDAKAPDARLREQVEAVDAAMLCVTPDQWKRASAWQIPDLPLMTSDQPASAEATLPELSQHPDAPAVLNFTSGTTGRSKAVLRSNRANQHDREWIHIARDERIERELLMRSFAQASGFTALLHVLSAGRTGVFFDLEKHSIAGLHSFIEAERIDEIALTIELHRRWLDSLPDDVRVGLKRLTLNGRIYGRDLTRTWDVLPPDADVQMRYSSTETGRVASVLYRPADEFAAEEIVPVGKPFSSTVVRILREDETPAAIDEIGRLFVASERLAIGYADREISALPSLHNHFRLYDTHDIASLDAEGQLRIFGRSDDVVKVNAWRIDLNEVDAALLAVPGVREACTYLSSGAGGENIVAACLVPTQDVRLDAKMVRTALGKRMPQYMIPTELRISTELPTTRIGKQHRAAVAAQASNCPLLPANSDAAQELITDATERDLAAIWSELLGRPIDDRRTDFLLSGGHSLAAMQLVDRIEQRMHIRLALTDVLTSSLLHEQAALIVQRKHNEAASTRLFITRGDEQSQNKRPPIFVFTISEEALAAQRRLSSSLSASFILHVTRFGLNSSKEKGELSIASFAQHCAEEILDRYPDGGTVLLGICGGSVLAHETARLLAERGAPPTLLIPLDPSRLPKRRRPQHNYDLRDFFKELMVMVRYGQYESLGTRLIGIPLRKVRNKLTNTGHQSTTSFQTQSEASWRHRPQPYAGHVLHIASAEFARNPEVKQRWSQLCPGDYQFIVLPRSSHRAIVLGHCTDEIVESILHALHL